RRPPRTDPGAGVAGAAALTRPHLAAAAYHVLEGGELLDADGAAGVHPAGGDTDLGAHAELSAVSELRRGVVQHDGAVEAGEEPLRRGLVLRDDTVGVLRAVLADVRHGGIDAVDGLHGDDGVEV